MAVLRRGCCCAVSSCVMVLGILTIIYTIIVLVITGLGLSATSFLYSDWVVLGTDINFDLIVAASIVQLVFTGLLLVGGIGLVVSVATRSHLAVITYLLVNVLQQVANLVALIIYGITFAGAPVFVGGYTASYLVYMLILVYCFLCAFSHYQNIRDGIDDKVNPTTTVIMQQHPYVQQQPYGQS